MDLLTVVGTVEGVGLSTICTGSPNWLFVHEKEINAKTIDENNMAAFILVQ